MSQPLAYLNGQWIPEDEIRVRPQDMGFMLGVTISEQLRTFGGQLFHWTAHAARLRRSLEILDLDVDLDELQGISERLVTHNHALLEPGNDLGLTIFVTPGIYPTYVSAGQASSPTIGVHTFALPFYQWADKYAQGQRCRIVPVTQVPSSCWPRELKCRSRMHYYLADQAARAIDEQARAILLDDGKVNEASTANVLVLWEGEGLVSPRRETILPGVSSQFVQQLAGELGIPYTYRDILPEELLHADEIMLTSTSSCLLPVSQLDDHVFQQRVGVDRLLAAWSDRVGLDIVRQAQQFA